MAFFSGSQSNPPLLSSRLSDPLRPDVRDQSRTDGRGLGNEVYEVGDVGEIGEIGEVGKVRHRLHVSLTERR